MYNLIYLLFPIFILSSCSYISPSPKYTTRTTSNVNFNPILENIPVYISQIDCEMQICQGMQNIISQRLKLKGINIVQKKNDAKYIVNISMKTFSETDENFARYIENYTLLSETSNYIYLDENNNLKQMQEKSAIDSKKAIHENNKGDDNNKYLALGGAGIGGSAGLLIGSSVIGAASGAAIGIPIVFAAKSFINGNGTVMIFEVNVVEKKNNIIKKNRKIITRNGDNIVEDIYLQDADYFYNFSTKIIVIGTGSRFIRSKMREDMKNIAIDKIIAQFNSLE